MRMYDEESRIIRVQIDTTVADAPGPERERVDCLRSFPGRGEGTDCDALGRVLADAILKAVSRRGLVVAVLGHLVEEIDCVLQDENLFHAGEDLFQFVQRWRLHRLKGFEEARDEFAAAEGA